MWGGATLTSLIALLWLWSGWSFVRLLKLLEHGYFASVRDGVVTIGHTWWIPFGVGSTDLGIITEPLGGSR